MQTKCPAQCSQKRSFYVVINCPQDFSHGQHRFFQFLNGLYTVTVFRYFSGWIAVQNQISIFQRCVVDQSVQFRPLIHIVSNFIFHGDSVNGNSCPISVLQLNEGGINVKLAGNQSVHRDILRSYLSVSWFL